MKEFQINKHLSLRLENHKTVIYVANKRFRTCKYLLINIKPEDSKYDNLKSIDEIIVSYKRKNKAKGRILNPETEFWGHCSNIQAWAENKYDSHLLDMYLAFPLLKELADAGERRAKKVFKEEIARRFQEGNTTVRKFLIEEGYINYLKEIELNAIGIIWVEYNGEKIPVIDNHLYLQKRDIDNLNKVKGLFSIPSLKILTLYNNNLSTIPQAIGNLKDLQSLRIDDNYISTLPKSIGNLTSLKSLWAQYNNLSSLPVTIGNLKNIEVLWLQKNNITHLPESLGNLGSLKKLWLRCNHLKNLPKSIGNLRNLEKLRLGDNNLTILPESLGNLHSITNLELQRNNLIQLPDSIGNLHSLKNLSLYNNQLECLPESMGNLCSLEHLYLNVNKITKLPESLGELQFLKKLSLSGNRLRKLPKSLLDLPALTHLNIMNNSLEASNAPLIDSLKEKGVHINDFDIWDF